VPVVPSTPEVPTVRPGTRRRLAVLGSPIVHSLSPVLHAAAYGVLGLDWEYTRAEVDSGGLAAFLSNLDDSWVGLSLTMPLKREVMPLLDAASPLARRLGVANTVVFTDALSPVATNSTVRAMHGYNTDVAGIVRAVASRGAVHPERTTILGGGATAASALAAAAELGSAAVDVYLRDVTRATDLVALAEALGVSLDIRPLESLDRVGAREFVISTLPGGVADGFAASLVPASAAAILFDVAYDPWPSVVATAWSSRGGLVTSGLDMLVEQAIGQIRLFSGVPDPEPLADENRVREAMYAAIDREAPVGRASVRS